MIDFNFNIRHGLSADLFSAPGVVNPNLVIEEGCWYICTDTAELFLGVLENNKLTLKYINSNVTGAVTKLELTYGNLIVTYSDGTTADLGKVVESIPTNISAFTNDAGYLTAHQPLDEYVKAEDLPEFDNFATKDELPSIEGLATEEFVTNAIKDIPEVDLSNYATKAEIPSLDGYAKTSDIPDVSKFITEVPGEYVTETELASKGFITEHQDIGHLATKEEIPDVSSFITLSDVEAKGYITEVPGEFITESELAEELAKIEHPSVDLSGYATEQFVSEAISEIEIPDVSNFITIDDVEAKGYIAEIPSEYVTESELSAKGFITDISGKADTEHKHSLSDIEDYSAPDLSEYAKRSEIPDVSDFIKEIPAEYITETELDAKGYLTEHQSLEDYAKKEELFSKSYNDLTDIPEIPSIKGLATEEFVRAEIEKIDVPTIDTTNLVTTEALNSALAVKANEVPFSSAKFITKPLGGFIHGENIKNLSIAEILAKLLGLVDEDPNKEEPEEPSGIVDNIVKNELPMYAVTADATLEEVPYKLLTLTEEEAATTATESGFYQIKNVAGHVVESGYQELQVNSDEVYYVIALPKDIDYDTMISLKVWDTLKNQWTDTGTDKLAMTSNPTTVAALCDEAGIDISHIDTSVYTVWALEDFPTGSKLRFVINE